MRWLQLAVRSNGECSLHSKKHNEIVARATVREVKRMLTKHSFSKVAQSCVWLFVTPWTIQSMEFSRPKYWSGQPFPSPGDLPNPGIKPGSPTLQVDSLPAEPPGKPKHDIQFYSVTQSCPTLQPHGLQHAMPPCPSPTPGVYPSSSPLGWWCHPSISSSVISFSSCLQSFTASRSFLVSQFFASGGQSITVD